VITDSIVVGNQSIAFRDSAGDGPAMVLVHGNSSSSATWEPLLTGPVGARYRCLALDLPGHGGSAPAQDPDLYSMPGYAAVLTGFLAATGVPDAVVVGWSLGGHVALEAAPDLPRARGFFIFGAPPVASGADLGVAFLPNPAMGVGFAEQVGPDDAAAYAASFVAAGSGVPPEVFVPDILATDGAARSNLMRSIGEGRFRDEVAIAVDLGPRLAIVQGEGEQLVSLDYLQGLALPALCRGGVQVMAGVGHAPQVEAPEAFAALLEACASDWAG
jgi:pimeloyl-ACP methyl ester carboxylesterase